MHTADKAMLTDSPATPPPSSGLHKARKAAIIGLLLLLALGFAFFSLAPSVDSRTRPTAGDVAVARDLLHQVSASRERGDITRLSLDARQIDALAGLAAETSGVRRIEAQVADGLFSGRASLPVPGGLWLNLAAEAAGAHDGFPAIRLRIGRIALPPAMSRWLADLSRWLLLQKGVDLPELDELVRHFAVADGTVVAELALPRRADLIERAVRGAGVRVDDRLVARIYCRLADPATPGTEPQLAPLVRLAFHDAGGPDIIAYNRAALVALALYVVGEQAHPLSPAAVENSRGCPPPATHVLLQQRADLAKHWAFSSALAAMLGEETATNLGEWKELHDSLPSGSGFSFVDLAANRSGMRIARQALDPKSAEATARALQAVSDADLLPPALTQAPEGLDEIEFAGRFGNRDERRYREAVSRIDRHLAGRPTR